MTQQVPGQHYTDEYFDKWNYADRPLGRFSMYWFARRYYASLVTRYAPPGGTDRKLVEMGCGLGDLLMLLQDDFQCTGVDLIPRSISETQRKAPKVEAYVGDATDFSRYADNELSVVVALHLVEHLPDPQKTIEDIQRVLVPGGLFLFATPHPEY
ncbi:MAG: class I SAM-dependent methyltransferase, partial [Aggregatilineales bacterium]